MICAMSLGVRPEPSANSFKAVLADAVKPAAFSRSSPVSTGTPYCVQMSVTDLRPHPPVCVAAMIGLTPSADMRW